MKIISYVREEITHSPKFYTLTNIFYIPEKDMILGRMLAGRTGVVSSSLAINNLYFLIDGNSGIRHEPNLSKKLLGEARKIAQNKGIRKTRNMKISKLKKFDYDNDGIEELIDDLTQKSRLEKETEKVMDNLLAYEPSTSFLEDFIFRKTK